MTADWQQATDTKKEKSRRNNGERQDPRLELPVRAGADERANGYRQAGRHGDQHPLDQIIFASHRNRLSAGHRAYQNPEKAAYCASERSSRNTCRTKVNSAKDTVVGAREVRAWGGQVKIVPLVEGCSTTRLIERGADQFALA